MPVDPIISSIIGSIIGSAVQQISALPPPSSPGIPSMAAPRALPFGTSRGELRMSGPMNADIDGKPMMLSPGVQVRDPFNMTILPSMVQGPVPVRYLTDPAGAVYRIWILSAQEAAQR